MTLTIPPGVDCPPAQTPLVKEAAWPCDHLLILKSPKSVALPGVEKIILSIAVVPAEIYPPPNKPIAFAFGQYPPITAS